MSKPDETDASPNEGVGDEELLDAMQGGASAEPVGKEQLIKLLAQDAPE